MKSINQINKEKELFRLRQEVEAVNNQIDVLENQSFALTQKILIAQRQLELIKSQEGIIHGS